MANQYDTEDVETTVLGLVRGRREEDRGWMADALRIHIYTVDTLSGGCVPVNGMLSGDLDLDDYVHIAAAIHTCYNEARRNEFPGSELDYPDWQELPDSLKCSNMCQALFYDERLRTVGCRMSKRDASVAEFTADEIERMSVLEHDRWVLERRAGGWRYGRIRDLEEKRTPFLVPWWDLPEEIREYDREAVLAMSGILRTIPIGIIRV